MYYMRKLAPLWIAYDGWKSQESQNLKIVRKKERSSVRGYELEKPSFLLLENENRSDLRIKFINFGQSQSKFRYNQKKVS